MYLACRSVARGEAAAAQIEARTGLSAAQRAPVMKLDLSSLTSVRNFVSEFKQREYTVCQTLVQSRVVLQTAQEIRIHSLIIIANRAACSVFPLLGD